MKFIVTSDRNGRNWVLNTAHIAAVTPRSERGDDWSEGAWIHFNPDGKRDDSIALSEKDAQILLKNLL